MARRHTLARVVVNVWKSRLELAEAAVSGSREERLAARDSVVEELASLLRSEEAPDPVGSDPPEPGVRELFAGIHCYLGTLQHGTFALRGAARAC